MTRPPVPSDIPLPEVELDRPRRLLFTLEALSLIKRQTGKSPLSGEAFRAMAEDVDVLGAVLWAGLRHEDPALTLEQVMASVPVRRLPEVLAAIGLALRGQLQDAGGEPARPPLGDSSTSSSSGPSPATTSA